MKIFIVLALIFTGACAKKHKVSYFSVDKPQGTHNAEELLSEELPEDTIPLKAVNLENIIDFDPNIKTNITLTPKSFIQITILFTQTQHSNYQNYKTSPKYSDEDISALMNQKRTEFYHNFGLTENSYIKYGVKNSEKIQTFLAENPEYSEAYELTQLLGTDQ